MDFFLSSRRRHTRCALATGVQTCALPICPEPIPVFPNIPVDPSNTMNAAAFACVEVVKAAARIPTENNIFFMKASPIRKYEIFTALQMLDFPGARRSEEHTSELQSLMRISYAVFCLKKKNSTVQNKK